MRCRVSVDDATESGVDRIAGEDRHCHTANTGQNPGSDTGQKQPVRSTKVVFSKPPLDGTANGAEHDHTEDEVELGPAATNPTANPAAMPILAATIGHVGPSM